MLFNSYTFLLFFACVLAVHSLPFPWTLRKFNLLVASYVYYAAWDVRFPLLLVYATATNLLAARLIAQWGQFFGHRRFVLWLNIALNIGLLCAFKYGSEPTEGPDDDGQPPARKSLGKKSGRDRNDKQSPGYKKAQEESDDRGAKNSLTVATDETA